MPTLKELANTIRMLTVDAIQKANSGHPGMPLGMADIATVLWREFLRHDPANPKWHNRDRFIISNGHGSMLLYSLLHLTGYGLTVSDIKQFRQLHSRTPGHPEYGVTVGVETTTGPLAQGLSNGVGMAIAEKIMAATFNRPGFEIIDHYTYVFVGDGCLMEGLSHEACSLAGTHRLGKLIVFWDDNKISIDGDTDGWFTDSTPERFRAYNWHVVADVDGHDFDSIRAAIKEARDVKEKPTLICCKTIIGYGAPNLCGMHDCHGSPLGTAEVSATRKNLNWPYTPFVIPNEFYEAWDARQVGRKNSLTWMQLFNSYKQNFPELAAEFTRRVGEKLPDGWSEKTRLFIHNSNNDPQSIATRQASQRSLNFYTELLPEVFGGSADLTGSCLSSWNKAADFTPENPNGNYMHYGIREFGMCGIMSGIALHGGLLPFGSTFLVFTDYARNAIRLAAMMKKRVIYVLSHDSIGLGEDGPTHQPVEHLTMLRATPNLSLWRPCDDIETATAWKMAIERTTGPTCLVLSRQKVPHQNRTPAVIDNIKRGGYILVDCEGRPELILIATGSEVSLAVSACYKLTAMGKKIRVVSLPSTDVFDAQDEPYKESVLPQRMTKRIAIEAASADYWYKYVGFNGKIIGMHTFGESAPAAEIYKYLKITEENIVETALGMLEKTNPVI